MGSPNPTTMNQLELSAICAASQPVTTNDEQRLYVIPESGGYSCLGFDVCKGRADRLAQELWKRDSIHAPGTLELYAELKELQSCAYARYQAQGIKASCELSPQLVGLEGCRVRVVDADGLTTRNFRVGKSTGWIPCHLELHNVRSTGGGPACRTYQSVQVIAGRR